MASRTKFKTIFASKKGLIATGLDEGNVSTDFLTVAKNCRYKKNGQVNKRRGRTRLNSVAFNGNANILRVFTFLHDFSNVYDILAYADNRELRRYTPGTGAFDVLIKSGLSPLADLEGNRGGFFNKRLIMGNGIDRNFEYLYLQAPVLPVVGSTASGALAQRNYQIKATYISANGESLESSVIPLTVAANNVLTVTSPIQVPGATGWNVYVDTVLGSETKQNATPIAIGTNFQEPDTGLIAGGALPTTNTAWAVSDLENVIGSGNFAPKTRFFSNVNHRVHGAGITNAKTRWDFSAVDNENDWRLNPEDAGSIDIAGVIAQSDEITMMGRQAKTNFLLIGLKNHLVIYDVDTVFNNIKIVSQLYNRGVVGNRAVEHVENDNYVVGDSGLISVINDILNGGLTSKTLSDNIREAIIPEIQAVADGQEISCVNNILEKELLIAFPTAQKRYVYNYEFKVWSIDENINVVDQVVAPDKQIFSCGGSPYVFREYTDAARVNIYGDDNDSVDVAMQLDTPWFYLDDVKLKKEFKYFQIKVEGSGTFEVHVFYDFAETAYDIIYLQAKPSNWDAVFWDQAYWGFPDINDTLIPMKGRGEAIKLSIRTDSQLKFQVSFYGMEYKLAGRRKSD